MRKSQVCHYFLVSLMLLFLRKETETLLVNLETILPQFPYTVELVNYEELSQLQLNV